MNEKSQKNTTPLEKGQEFVPIKGEQGNNKGQQLNAISESGYYQTVNISSQSFFFNPDIFRVKSGEKVTVNVMASGNHTFVIDELKINKKTPDGKTTKIEFTPKEEGAFHYYCDEPGHKDIGQTGTILVTK